MALEAMEFVDNVEIRAQFLARRRKNFGRGRIELFAFGPSPLTRISRAVPIETLVVPSDNFIQVNDRPLIQRWFLVIYGITQVCWARSFPLLRQMPEPPSKKNGSLNRPTKSNSRNCCGPGVNAGELLGFALLLRPRFLG
jgi:hypothetical protein